MGADGLKMGWRRKEGVEKDPRVEDESCIGLGKDRKIPRRRLPLVNCFLKKACTYRLVG